MKKKNTNLTYDLNVKNTAKKMLLLHSPSGTF